MKIERNDDTATIVFRKMRVVVPRAVADFYLCESMWHALRTKGPMRQSVAVYRAYEYVTRKFLRCDRDVSFPSLSRSEQAKCKKLMRSLIAPGLQSGLIRYNGGLSVRGPDPSAAKEFARALVENRVVVDKSINGTYL